MSNPHNRWASHEEVLSEVHMHRLVQVGWSVFPWVLSGMVHAAGDLSCEQLAFAGLKLLSRSTWGLS